jgi:AbrB family looped-hinge helix DNA binding protein
MAYISFMTPIPDVQRIRVGPQGRLVIPAKLRRALQVAPGDTLVAWAEGDQIILRSRRVMEEELWAMFRDVKGSMSEELIRERREEAERELAD